jgi:NAD(P)-dependent dehydrogenase (short-subunit alcohol dehydrogenase family)
MGWLSEKETHDGFETNGKRALVSGSKKGIGLAIATALARDQS